MKNEYQERITCCKCKAQYDRELEIMEVAGQTSQLEQPLSVVIVKKFKCKKCKEDKNYSVEIIKKDKKPLKIANN
jgi:hypothetical protein